MSFDGGVGQGWVAAKGHGVKAGDGMEVYGINGLL